MSLATYTILFEKRRYSTAIIAIAFCGELILSFTGLFSGQRVMVRFAPAGAKAT